MITTVRELHEQAMQLAQQAQVVRYQDDAASAEALARQALEYERQAADLVPDAPESEPTRSILYRSAASLALQAHDFAAAQRLVAKGLAGYPPPRVERELKALYERVNYEAHLRVRGVVLQNEDMQVALSGSTVGPDSVIYTEFARRMDRVTRLIERTLQRLLDMPYKGSGRPAASSLPLVPTLSTPRSGSFAVTLKLAVPQYQTRSMLVTAKQVIEVFLHGIQLIEDDRQEDLRHYIEQPLYYQNFVYLTRDLAPDGERVSLVGFTTLESQVALSKRHTDIAPLPDAGEEKPEPIEVIGLLDYAVSRKKREQLGLTTADGMEYTIKVKEGMDDIVRAYFRQNVLVRGILNDKKLILADDIQAVD